MTHPHQMTIDQINEMHTRYETLSVVEKSHLSQAILNNKEALQIAMVGAERNNNMNLVMMLYAQLKKLENKESLQTPN